MPNSAIIRGCPTRLPTGWTTLPPFTAPPWHSHARGSALRRPHNDTIAIASTAAAMIVEQETEIFVDKIKSVPVTIVSSALGSSAATNTAGVIIAHGAGGNKDSGHLPSVAQCLGEAGFPSIRFTCKPPNMKTRTKHFKAVLMAAHSLPNLQNVSSWIFFGHSMGGRVACAVAEEGFCPVLGCILSSYPLHPPDKHEELRDHPLCDLELPMLFLRGTRDPFSTRGPWEDVIGRLSSSNVKIHTLETGDHSLKVKGGQAKNKEAMEEMCREIVSFAFEISSNCLGERGDLQATSSSSVSEDLDMEGAGGKEESSQRPSAKRKNAGKDEHGWCHTGSRRKRRIRQTP